MTIKINDLNKLILECINEVLEESSCAACGENLQSDDVSADIADLEKLLANPDPDRAKDYGSIEKYKEMLRKKIDRLKSGSHEHEMGPEYRVRSDEPEPFGYDDGSMDEEYKTDQGKKKAKKRILKLKSELDSIRKKMDSPHYTDDNDPQSRLFHQRRLKEIPKIAQQIRQKILGLK